MIGGTVGNAFVIGGGFVGQDLVDPDLELDVGGSNLIGNDLRVDGSLGLGVVGPFVDWFPDEHGGLHAGAMIGLGIVGLRDSDGGTGTSGLGASAWLGHGWWVADQWSLGFNGKLVYATHSRSFSGDTLDDQGLGFQLVFSALLH